MCFMVPVGRLFNVPLSRNGCYGVWHMSRVPAASLPTNDPALQQLKISKDTNEADALLVIPFISESGIPFVSSFLPFATAWQHHRESLLYLRRMLVYCC